MSLEMKSAALFWNIIMELEWCLLNMLFKVQL